MVRNVNPYRQNAGYVRHMPCKLGGDVVVYDSEQADFDVEAGERWVVMHEPSSLHVAVATRAQAVDIMLGVALAESVDEARFHADILPQQSKGEDE